LNIVVQKYGGSSVADADKIKNVALRISEKVKKGYKVIIVVSAMGKSTDGLVKLAKEISSTPDPRELDMLLSTGEQVSVSLLSMALKEIGLRCKSLNAFQAGIRTTDEHIALAAALKVDCEIYSDVAGIYSIDPRLYPAAKKRKFIAYDEMLEMASLGAKVLHSRSVEIAKKFNIKIYCGSSFINEEGSYVVNENIIIEEPVVTGCSVVENETQVFIKNLPVDYRLVKSIFEKTATEGLNVDMISIINTDSNLVVSFTIIESKREQMENALNKVFEGLDSHEIEFHTGYLKLSVVGIGMRSGIGVASSFFHALEDIPIKLVTTSEIKISCLIESKYKQQAVDAIVKEFNL
jgi:aspartate kinase